MFFQTEFATVKDNTLYIDGVSALELAKEYGTPLYVMSKGHIRKQLSYLKNDFLEKYENVLPLFASKSFSCKAMYKLAKEYGVGLDCVSAGEISIALASGYDPDKIYFHGNNKLPSEIEYALENDVIHFVVDNFYEIEIGNEIAKRMQKKIQATVRITPGVYAGGHDYIRVGAKDTKFGFSNHDGSYLTAIRQIIASPNMEFEGIHFHIGSQIEDIQAYELALAKFVDITKEIYDQLGVNVKKLNTGGGYGIAYTKEDHPVDFVAITETIMKVLSEAFAKIELPMPMVLIEPGRFVVGNAGITLYTVGSIKDIQGIRKYISVDGGMTDNIRASLYGAKYGAVIANRAGDEPLEEVTVAGKNCESGDILIKDILLAYPKPGDILACFSTGAYHYSMSSNYNQLPKPAVVFVENGKSELIVRRQTFADLIAYDVE